MKFLTRTIIVLAVLNLAMVEPPEPMQPGTALPVPTPVEPTQPTASGWGGMTISGNVGLSGVTMFGLPHNIVTNERGDYTGKVPSGWRGKVMPVKEGYAFKPVFTNYGTINSHQTNQNYVATVRTFIISGTTGISGVVMDGLPGNPVTDKEGYYIAKVYYGWSGTVTPTKEGYAFEPSELRYSKVTHDMNNQAYRPKRLGPAPIFGRTGSRKVLVIPDTEVKTEELVAITQDLHVMSHIFDERFKEPRLLRGKLFGEVFIDFGDFFPRDSRATEAIYLQGYGALFLMEVNFAFTPPPKAQEKQAKKTEDVDPTWQRARQQIFSPKGFGGDSEFFPEERYSAEKIDQLKTELIKTLKHAANIRNLKPDEWVILTVIGQGRQSGGVYEDYYRTAPMSGTSTSRRSRRPSSRSSSGGGGGSAGGYGGGMPGGMGGMMGSGGMGGMMGGYSGGMYGGGMGSGMMGGMEYEYGEIGPPSATVLTIRAKKSDVDAFAAGELDFEQFQQTVEIFTY